MKLEDYKDIWNDLGKSVEKSWKLDMYVLRRENLSKTSDKLKNLYWVKLLILCFFLSFTVWLIAITAENWSNVYTSVTLISFELWTSLVSLVLMYKLYLIKKIAYTDPLPLLLKKLSLIKLSTIRLLRLGTVILPFNTVLLSYYLLFDENLISDVLMYGIDWVSGISLGFCALVSIWSFRKISPKNANKKWMYKLLKGNGSQVLDAMSYLKQIEELENDNKAIDEEITDMRDHKADA